MFVSLGVLILLSTLGVPFGASSAAAAGIWGAISAIIGFFVGGWFVGRTIDYDDSMVVSAHGLLVWATCLIFTLIFTITFAVAGINSVANILHAAGITNLLGLANYGATGASSTSAAAGSNAVTSAWAAFFIVLLSLVAAIGGANVGNRARPTDSEER
jgi:hypothetical protein